MSQSARTNILNKIRKALEQPTPLPFPDIKKEDAFFQPQQDELVVEFAEHFSQLQGKFIFCADEKELLENFQKLISHNKWTKVYCSEKDLSKIVPSTFAHEDIATCDASVTTCEALVARTGSMVLSAAEQGRIPSVYAPVHVCIANTSQLVYDVKDALVMMQEKYKNDLPSFITFATGPSRTADIEKTLVVGVHGPKEVYCFVVDNQP